MARPITRSLKEYTRGLTGGLLFGLPLIYTMEMWWSGFIAGPLRLIAALAVTFGLLFAYNYFAGIRRDHTLLEVACDSIEELGLSLLLASALLMLLRRITPQMQFSEIVGRLTVEVMVMAIGISVGRAQLGSNDDDDNDEGTSNRRKPGLASHVAIGACGAVLVALNVAPTEEVLMLGVETRPLALIGLAALSLALIGVVLYLSDFVGARHLSARGGFAMLRDSMIMYAVALLSSAFLLWFFGRFDGLHPPLAVALIVVLGLAASLGASAGRLILHFVGTSPK